MLGFGGCAGAGWDMTQEIAETVLPGDPRLAAAVRALGGRSVGPIDFIVTIDPIPLAGTVNSINLRRAALIVTNDTACWDFVDSVHVRIDLQHPDPEYPPIPIGEIHRPGCVPVMEIEPNEEPNLRPYLERGAVVVASAYGWPPDHDVPFRGTMVFHIEAF
jgi:hypothetical protein